MTSHNVRLEVEGVLEHRDVVLRTVSAACRLCARSAGDADDLDHLRSRVVSAVGEAFNNIAMHGYDGRPPGRVEIEVTVTAAEITIRLRDDGATFDPREAPVPDLGTLPESGLGTFIIRSFMDRVDYAPGPPNVLTLSVVVKREEGRQ